MILIFLLIIFNSKIADSKLAILDYLFLRETLLTSFINWLVIVINIQPVVSTFILAHRFYLEGVSHINSLGQTEVIIVEHRLPLSRSQRKLVLSLILKKSSEDQISLRHLICAVR